MINHGYMGKYVVIDLTSETYEVRETEEELITNYIGCSGYAVKWLWDNTDAKQDAFAPEQPILFATGPIAGTLCPSGGSYELCFKSPLTGAWCESRSGGSFGAKLKYAGFDYIIVKGKATRPVYLHVKDNHVDFKDASHLWGHGVIYTTESIQEEIRDKDASVAAIGRAGENLIRFAAIINDRGRAAGRGGGGAVLGSKNLKAIAVHGSQDIKIADPAAFATVSAKAEEYLKRYPYEGVNQFGTPLLFGIQNSNGSLPTKNFTMGQYADADMIGGEAVTENYLIKRRACYGCSMGCGRYTQVLGGEWETPPIEGPEYETLNTFGSLNCNNNLASIIYANHLCNEYGMDTISTGAVISFATECFEKGIITEKDTNGISLSWGDAKSICMLIDLIADRKGIGDTLAEGENRAAEIFGSNAADYAVTVKGMEVPAHEPRGESKVLALQYAVSPRGACHMHPNWAAIWDSGGFICGMNDFGQPWPPTDKYAELNSNKGLAYRFVALQGEITEILGGCIFHSWGADDACLTPALYAEIMTALTGIQFSKYDLFKAADRSWLLKRCYNLREGFTAKDDDVPKRLKEKLPGGPAKGQSIENIKGMLREYYAACGWDTETGVPLEKTLKDLGLDFVLSELEP